MAEIQLKDIRVSNKADTYANWKSRNPILKRGEVGFEYDTNRSKMGNGSSNWNDLPYTNSCEITGLEVSYTNETPTILYTIPEDYYINIIQVTVSEAWDENTSITIGNDMNPSWILGPDDIDLTLEGLTFMYNINEKVKIKTPLKVWITKVGVPTSGKLTIDIK